MFKNQPAGLYVLALANTGERFGYYTMLAIFLLFLQAKFGFDASVSGQIYAGFLAMVYFMPLIGGWVADRWNFNKCVITGIIVMFIGYAIMSMQTPIHSNFSLGILIVALLLIAVGTGLFKGNLQVMVGDLYNEPKYSNQRDSAFSLFYMAINIGSMFAPMTATAMLNWHMHRQGLEYVDGLPAACNELINAQAADKVGEIPALTQNVTEIATKGGLQVSSDVLEWANTYITSLSNGYSWGFAIACASLVVSYCIYAFGKRTYKHIIANKKEAGDAKAVETGPELTPAQTKARVIALLLVFAVVIFFWMVFHQNGATLTEFAKTCTSSESHSWTRIGFNVGALAIIAVGVYALFSLFQSKKNTGRIVSGLILAGCVVSVIFIFRNTENPLTGIQPQQYQQFNPFYVVALTPVSLAIFGWLASRKKEPSAPRKIGYGMIMAGAAYALMCIGSATIVGRSGAVSPNWLISTYLVLTFAELLLSPMGISFVSKVAPPKLKGSMMGGWFAATAVGNYLVSIPMLLWDTKLPLWSLWGILIIICLISAIFIFSIMKKLEAATSDNPAVDPQATEMANAAENE